jgi:hypothetical protein
MGKELMMLKAHLTEEKKVELATNWFAENWAITKAVGMLHDYDRLLRKTTPPAAQPAPVQEPVATVQCINGVTIGYLDVMQPVGTKLYTTPPAAKRQWVGLTDEEIEQGCKESWVTEQAFQSAVWWAEAKLKEKNNG